MDLVSKLRSTVSTVTSAVSSALPGNPVTREYEPLSQIASAGPGFFWKLYSGYKRTSKQEVTIWLFEKKSIDKWNRRDREQLLELLKKGVAQLTRLRHPRLLVVEHALEESRESLAFATEPVLASLANVLGQLDNMPELIPDVLKNLKLENVEIRNGLLQIAEALVFLHNDAHIVHRSVCPNSVILNTKGDWKLAGFDFCLQGSRTDDSGSDSSFTFSCAEFDSDLHPFAQPRLDYLAPQYSLGGTLTPSADMYSVGILCHAIFNNGRALVECSTYASYKKALETLKILPSKYLLAIPEEFREYVKLCLSFNPDLRPDAIQFTKIPYFNNNPGVKLLLCLDSLCQLDNLQKSQFFKSLPKILCHIPKRLRLSKVLNALSMEYSTPEMVPFVLPSLLTIVEDVSKEEFQSAVFPALIPVFALRTPIQIPLILLQNMDLLLRKTTDANIVKYLLPVVYSSMESNNVQLQELCLAIIPNIVQLVDANSMKMHLIPKLLLLVTMDSSSVTVKVNALLCIGKLLENLERWMVRDQILPELPKIGSREPAVLMAVVGIYRLAFSSAKLGMSKESCARSALPFLLPLCVENSLNLNQFQTVIALINDMLAKIECEQCAKLEQLSTGQEDQRSGVDINKVLNTINQRNGSLPDVFKDMGIDERNSSSNGLSKSTTFDLNNAVLPTQKAKATGGALSLEEKQRLSREQEQQALNPRSSEPLKLASGGFSSLGAADFGAFLNNSNNNNNSVFSPTGLATTSFTTGFMAVPSSVASAATLLKSPPAPVNPLMRVATTASASTLPSAAGVLPTIPPMSAAPMNNTSSSYQKPASSVDLSAFDDLLKPSSSVRSPFGSTSQKGGATPMRNPTPHGLSSPDQNKGMTPPLTPQQPGWRPNTQTGFGGAANSGLGQQQPVLGQVLQPVHVSKTGFGMAQNNAVNKLDFSDLLS